MNPKPTPLQLQVGGALTPGKDIYIERPEDRQLFELLAGRAYANVLCARQMGKSSLMEQTARRLEENADEPSAVVIIGCDELSGSWKLDDWYCGMLQDITNQLELNVNPLQWWDSHAGMPPNQRLLRFFRDEVAAQISRSIVVFLDEIDATLRYDYTDDFFVAIRAMYNQCGRTPAYERISFCLVGVATPNELIKDHRTTPYNIGTTLSLHDFDPDRDDLSLLVSCMHEDTGVADAIIRAIIHQTGGHPFLTTWMCAEFHDQELKTADKVQNLTEQMFANLDAVRRHVHFETILRLLKERTEDRRGAFSLYRRVWAGELVQDEVTSAHNLLQLTGLVKRNEVGQLIVRNRIYEQLFNHYWIDSTIDAIL